MDDAVPFLPVVADLIDANNLVALEEVLQMHPEQLRAYTPFAGGTWLHYAAGEGFTEVVELLLTLGADCNAGAKWNGRNALVDAAEYNRYPVAKCLLDHGAHMAVDSSAKNPLFAAIIGCSPDIVKLLLERGMDSTVRYNSDTMKDMDAVAFAMMQGEREIAHMIALWNAKGDEDAARLAMERGLFIAHRNTTPVDPDEEYANS